MMTSRSDVLALREHEGEARWWLGALAIIKVRGADTGGRYSLIEMIERDDAYAPLHVHHNEDEAFWVLEGHFTFRVGDQTIPAGPGSFVFGPKRVPHTYKVEKGPARLLFLLSPAGMEDLILETSRPATALELPPAPDEHELARFMEVVGRYGGEILE